jgi:D-lactate dehydrogenase (cytochrome)
MLARYTSIAARTARSAAITSPSAVRAFHVSAQCCQEQEKQSDSNEDSNKKENNYKRYSSLLSSTALLVIGVLGGTSWAAFNLCRNPPEFVFPHTSTLPLDKTISPTYGDSSALIAELKPLLKEDQITVSTSELDNHSDSFFSTDHPAEKERPDAIIYPESTKEVSLIMRHAHKHHVPIVPYTGGTSLEGHYIPTRRGVCIDLSRMNKIVKLNKEDLDIIVQPAVGWEDLADYLNPLGLIFGPDPGPGACIGGMCGTSCSGTNAARYGTMRENVISLTVVMADGTIIKTKRRPRKSSAGYNLTNLFVGSEGTLGIVTEATLKLYVLPKFENVAVVSFPTLDDAANAVAKIVQTGVQVNALELLDANMMQFVNQSGNVTNKYAETPTLMMKLGGNSANVVKELTNDVKKICNESHCGKDNFRFASSDEEKEELWTARKVALWSTLDAGKLIHGDDAQIWTTDVAVPISKLVESLVDARRLFDEANLTASIVSHAGDGNYHAFIIYQKKDHDMVAHVVEKMVQKAIELDGTVTGEHGVGIGKREYLKEELGDAPIDLMRKIKFALDPLLLLNPDKVFQIDPNEAKRH